nr:succinylglutamate desuccinylase/aspartoacylase family protein [uncultured Blautia sp.]
MQKEVERELALFRKKTRDMVCGNILAESFSVDADGIKLQIPYYYLKGKLRANVKKQPVIWVEAALHGDEYDGIITVMQLLEELKPEQLSGDVLLVPILNVSAYEGQANGSPVDGVNLNRVFDREQPGNTFSYKYGEVILGLILGIADCVVDLHGGGQYLDVDSFASVPRQANEKIESLAEQLQINYICRHLQKGMLIERLIGEGIPAILLESGGGLSASDATVRTHKENVLRILQYFGFLDNVPVKENEKKPVCITQAEHLYFQEPGVLLYNARVGDIVKKEDLLLSWVCTADGKKYELTCPIEKGVILSIHTSVQVRKGAYAVMIGHLEN